MRLPFGQRWTVDHGSGVALIYGASVALWLFMGLYSIVQPRWIDDVATGRR
jgi:hypothetical protein